jgi:hypothetical protein
VIRLALNQLSSSTAEKLDENIANELDYIGKKYGVTLSSTDAPQKFKELIRELYDAHAPVVILIDEYDKPILDNILESECVSQIRTFLKSFYGIIKASEEYLRFTFITGVSKFTQVSIFSDLNNLTDITLDPEFATICGFTQEECEHYFAEWIEENAEKLSMTRDEYLAKIKETYDGIRFTKKDAPVYNPVSFTRAMQHGDFQHFWFETGTPTFLLKLLKERNYDVVNFEELKLVSSGFSSYEIEMLEVEPLLYQTGYLTIKDYDPESEIYTLSYPNKEVKQAFLERLLDYFSQVRSIMAPSMIEDIRTAFLNDDMDEIFEVLKVFYSKIDNTIKIKQEKYYQTVFYILFTLLGYRIKAEVNTNKGRMDAVIKTDKIIYIFEFKLNKTPKEAIEQIKQREYYQKYLLDNIAIKLIGVQFNYETGEIKEWEVEEKG